jgi:hypothetical protein
MKSRFLDIRNCHELLPRGNGLPLIARLDECLEGINNTQGSLHGSIDSLIRQNEKTCNQKIGSKRLCNSPIEIGQGSYIEKRIVHTQAVQRMIPGPALLHTVLGYENGMMHKTIVPLQFLLKGWGDAGKDYQCYIHTISENFNNIKNFNDLFVRNMTDSDNYYYVGITGRNWLLRLEEHIQEMRQGNRRLFYKVWREKYGISNVLFTSFLEDINLSFQDAMNWEELNVDKIANDQYGLNMIPGGFKGLKLLHKCRIISNMNISLEEREMAIADYFRKNPRRGIPNPFIAELWKDDDFYLKVIEAREKTLSPEQVRKIRELNKFGKSIIQITKEVDALNELQVKNVILGRTYSRIV